MKHSLSLILFFFCLIKIQAQDDVEITKNLVYAEVENKKLTLDIYKPKGKKDPYLIVWVHGGA